MTANPRTVAEKAARELLRALSALPDLAPLRVTEVEGGLACLLVVWDAKRMMPLAKREKRKPAAAVRVECKRDIVEVLKRANRPLTRKEVVKALKEAGKAHGRGTVFKALADLTKSRELVNPQDKRGYRMPDWDRERPTLFD